MKFEHCAKHRGSERTDLSCLCIRHEDGRIATDAEVWEEIERLRARTLACEALVAGMDILCRYSRTDGHREWVNVGLWMYPGDVVVHMDDPRPLPP